MPSSGSEPPSSAVPTRRRGDRMEVGSRLGRYTIEGALGEGGMGVVYRARDARLGRKVALKVLFTSDEDPDSVERAKRFLREARAAAALDHPNAVAIFDVGEEADASFMAMELVNGRSLRAFVGAAEPDIPSRLRWLSDIASALAAAHAARLIHRDIKPENVMVRDDGRVKVLDFGLARRVARPSPDPEAHSSAGPSVPRVNVDPVQEATFTDTTQTTLTGVGTLLGTPQYMAPEQIRSEALDARSDQFSWGIVAYELLSGQLPWAGAGIGVMARILASEPRPLRELAPAVPEEVAAVVARALQKSPDDRFPSMDAVIAALEPWAEPPSRSDPRSIRPRAARDASSPRPPASNPFDQYKTQRSADHVPPAAEGAAPRAAKTARPPPKVEVVDAPPEPIQPRGLVLAVAAIALVLGAVIGWRTLRARAPLPAGPVASASGAPSARPSVAASGAAHPTHPTAVTDLPDPRSSNAAAIAAYRAGLAELRFGGNRDALERAAVLDPALAAAHLQCAVDATEYPFDEAGRAHVRKAGELRDQLTERDQLLLDAIVPVLLRQPADFREADRRLGAALERYPEDAQLWYERGLYAQISEGPAKSEPYVARAIAIDPKYAQAMSLLGQDLLYLDRIDEARALLVRCVDAAPSYVTCGAVLASLYEHEGACEEEEALARRLVTASTSQDVAQGLLARALAARGRPEGAVREALRLREAATAEGERAHAEAEDAILLDLWAGDFASAEARAQAMEAALGPSAREADHGRPARLLAQIYTETGRAADAARVAERYLSRREGWQPDERAEDYAMAGDATPDLLAAEARAGKLPRADLVAKRAEWLRGWDRRATPFFRRYLWAHGFAGTVETADDAREALAALPGYEPLPTFYPKTVAEAAIGHAFLLAGRADDAIRWLERAARTCRVLDLPVEHTLAHWWLGQAREAHGDKAGACAAYKVVRDRWGKAKPPSVTAGKAAERLRALACGG